MYSTFQVSTVVAVKWTPNIPFAACCGHGWPWRATLSTIREPMLPRLFNSATPRSPSNQSIQSHGCRGYVLAGVRIAHLFLQLPFPAFYFVSAGLPELSSERSLDWLRSTLMLDAPSEEVASAHFRRLITVSLGTRATQFNDACHLLKHG